MTKSINDFSKESLMRSHESEAGESEADGSKVGGSEFCHQPGKLESHQINNDFDKEGLMRPEV